MNFAISRSRKIKKGPALTTLIRKVTFSLQAYPGPTLAIALDLLNILYVRRYTESNHRYQSKDCVQKPGAHTGFFRGGGGDTSVAGRGGWEVMEGSLVP